MITYCVNAMRQPCDVRPGDSFRLSIQDRETGKYMEVCRREITETDTISYWAFVNIPGIGMAYFIGNEKLAEFIVERFPDAEKEIPFILLDKPS